MLGDPKELSQPQPMSATSLLSRSWHIHCQHFLKKHESVSNCSSVTEGVEQKKIWLGEKNALIEMF